MSMNCPPAKIQCLGTNQFDELCPANPNEVSYFIQEHLNGDLEIPPQKPSIEEIFNTRHDIEITKCAVITVKRPAGKKVLIVGHVTVGVEYIAKVPDQKVHFAHWVIQFQVLLKNQDGSLLDPSFDPSLYIPHVCVEHEEYCQIDERHISKELVLLVWLQRKDN